MEFIDRKEELMRLRNLMHAPMGKLAVIYGRRRIGKSCLLTKWCQECDGFYWVADTSTSALQRIAFSEAFATRFPGFDGVIYPSWHSLFKAVSLRARLEGWHGPMIFDEFPYLVAADEALPGVFQEWIDTEIREQGIVAVISGSSQHIMQGLTLQADNPLYGRAQEILALKPLAAGHIQNALNLSSPVQAIKAYAVWGGIPRYWQSAEKYADNLEQSVDDLVFNPLGLFHEEPIFLLQGETPNAIGLRPYLDVIGYGAHRISEMSARLQQAATALSRPIARLIQLGLIQRQLPFGENEKSSKKSLYTISDPFCHLWFQVIAPRRSLFENATSQGRKLLWRRYANAIFSYQWEVLCRSQIHRIRRIQELLPNDDCWMPAKRWWHENRPEWDIVTSNLMGDATLWGEVKWSETPFSCSQIRELALTLSSRDRFKVASNRMFHVLIVPSMESNAPSLVNDVVVLTAQDILDGSIEE